MVVCVQRLCCNPFNYFLASLHVRRLTCTHTNTNTHTETHARAHTHTHTHTHVCMYTCMLCPQLRNGFKLYRNGRRCRGRTIRAYALAHLHRHACTHARTTSAEMRSANLWFRPCSSVWCSCRICSIPSTTSSLSCMARSSPLSRACCCTCASKSNRSRKLWIGAGSCV